MKSLPRFVFLGLLCFSGTVFAGSDWVALFNGKDLSGWSQKGGTARYRTEDGAIVGASVPNTPNSFLCTQATYGDFVLEYDFKVDPRLNSGVQVRSHCFDTETKTEWAGKTFTIPPGRVHGYQVEIDPDVDGGRCWTAGVYDEARRGWLFPNDGPEGAVGKAFSARGKQLLKPGEWNHVRVEAIGDSLRTWLNGQLCADLRDGMTPRGFIALQVHDIGNNSAAAGAEVRWRNVRIKEKANTLSEAEKADGWALLWNGRDTQGWRGAKASTFPQQGWKIEDGVLTVLASGGGESRAGGDIVTINRYSDFELRLDFKIAAGANSGVKYFCQAHLAPITSTGEKAKVGSGIGLEYQILDDERHPDAKLGRDGNRTIASLYDLLAANPAKRPSAIGEWNTALIVSRQQHVEHWLNGKKVLEYERGSPVFRELVVKSKYHAIAGFGEWADGHILLQDHGNLVSFRSIKIRDLSSRKPSP